LLHPAADGLKFFTKEDFMRPRRTSCSSRSRHLAMGMVFTLVGTIPFGDTVCLHEFRVQLRTSSRAPPYHAGRVLGDPKNGYFPIDLQIAPRRRRASSTCSMSVRAHRAHRRLSSDNKLA